MQNRPFVQLLRVIRRHWFALLLLIASLLAGIFFHYASKLPDAALFYLKLTSFSATALLGIVGTVADFKDDNKKLTTAGKLNLVGLTFVAIVGIATQRAEGINATKAATDLDRGLARNMAPIGDTISVHYHAEIPLNEFTDEAFHLGNEKELIAMVNQQLRNEARRYDPRKADVHTVGLVNARGKKVFMFDRESSFARGNDITQSPLFVLEFYKTKPEFDKQCLAKPDLRFAWDRSQMRTEADPFDSLGKRFDDVQFIYEPDSVLTQLSENVDDSKFKLTESSLRLQSVVDLNGAYVSLLSTQLVNAMLFNLTIRVGGLPLELDVRKPLGQGCYSRTFQLRVLGKNK